MVTLFYQEIIHIFVLKRSIAEGYAIKMLGLYSIFPIEDTTPVIGANAFDEAG